MSTLRCIEPGCRGERWALRLCLEHFLQAKAAERKGRLRFWRQCAATTYEGVHSQLRRNLGAACTYPCADCGTRAQDWSYQGGAPDEQPSRSGPFSRDPSRYVPRCRSCHKRHDVIIFPRKPRTHCRQGHPLDADNSHVIPSQPTYRRCRACERQRHVAQLRVTVGYNENFRPSAAEAIR